MAGAMRERNQFTNLQKIGAAHHALRLASQETVTRQAGERSKQESVLREAEATLLQNYDDWRSLLSANVIDPILLRLQAASMPGHERAVDSAKLRLNESERRLDASRLALAHATVRVRQGHARQKRLLKQMARRAEDKRLAHIEEEIARSGARP